MWGSAAPHSANRLMPDEPIWVWDRSRERTQE